MTRRSTVWGIWLGLVVGLIHTVGFAETNEVADPDLAKEISYLTLAVRDRYCVAHLRNDGEGRDAEYAGCMHKNEKISYCRARPVDFEELAAMMAVSEKLSPLLPLDRLVRYVSDRCIEIDGFVPPPLPLVTIEAPTECGTNMPVLLANAASMPMTAPTQENIEKGQWCDGNIGLTFLADECYRGARGVSFAGHKDFCRWPIKPSREDRK